MKPASAVTWGLLWALTASSIAVGCFGLYVSLKATSRASYYQAQAVALMQENQGLKERLASMATKRQELVISVAGNEDRKTLAQKNRNYLNIRSNDPMPVWVGAIGRDRFNHVIFEDAAYSIRAGAIILRTYEQKHGIKTVRKLVERFAEGNQAAYINYICKALSVKPDEEFSLTSRLPELLRAMVKFETGMHLGEEHLALVAALR